MGCKDPQPISKPLPYSNEVKNEVKSVLTHKNTENNTRTLPSLPTTVEYHHPLQDHITMESKDNITTITIDEAYTKTLGITWAYVCHLIQDTDDKNYYVFESNIDKLVIDNKALTTYLQKNDGFEDLIILVKEKNPDIDTHIAESILSMNIKDQSYNPITQAVFNYIYTKWENYRYNKVMISDIYKAYISLSKEKMYDKLLDEMTKLENEEIPELQGKVIEKKLNKLAPYILIENNN